MRHRMQRLRLISNSSMILRRLDFPSGCWGLSFIVALMHCVGHSRTQTMQPVQYGSSAV